MATRVEVKGAKELRRAFRQLPPEYRKELAAIHKRIARPVAETARVLAPKQSGALAASIRPLGSQRSGRIAAGRKSVPYAGPIHWGWPRRNIEPQPFLVDALTRNQNQIADNFTRETDKLIDRVWREEKVLRR